jgi:hypothetical protein
VREILERDFTDIQAQRTAILGRAAQIAVAGDDDASIRAAQLLAKISGWVPDGPTSAPHVSLYTIINGDRTTVAVATPDQQKVLEAAVNPNDPLAVLAHEPGEPIRISSGDPAITAAQAGMED